MGLVICIILVRCGRGDRGACCPQSTPCVDCDRPGSGGTHSWPAPASFALGPSFDLLSIIIAANLLIISGSAVRYSSMAATSGVWVRVLGV